jgi:hypothetical protein
MWPMAVVCWISKAKRSKAHGHAHELTPTLLDSHPPPPRRARTHTHTQKFVRLVSFPRQQWFREDVPLLFYTYIGCVVQPSY